MKNYAKNQIQKMKAYEPPLEDRGAYEGLLLDFGERTVPVSDNVKQALLDFANSDKVRIYPEYSDLCEKIAKYCGAESDQIMLSNGSDKAIDVLFQTFTSKGGKVIIPSPSFAMFYQYATVQDNDLVMPEYKANGDFPLDEVLDEIDERTSLVIVCNPNNPTGNLVLLEDIEKILEKALEFDAIVYVDEAYYEFSQVTAVSLVKKYPNLIITRTFSKAFGLAALRIGYAISQKQNIDEMLKIRGPYDVNMAATVVASAALDDISYVENYVNEVMNEAKPMIEKFFDANGINYFPSSANFILFKPDEPEKVFKSLEENGIRTRPKGGNFDGTVRVTVGTAPQMKEFIDIFKKIPCRGRE